MCSSTHRLTRSSFTFSMFLALAISSALADGSRGTPTDPEVDRIHSEAIRVYYHDPDTVTTYSEWVRDETGAFYWATVHGDRFTSVKENALLDDQTLYYDYYPPLTSHPKVNKVCAMFFHGGGYTVGYANQGYDTEIRPFREAGFHVISVEYRRGWFGTGKSGPGSGEPDIPREDADRFEVAVEDAFEDVQEAWDHLSLDVAGHARFLSAGSGYPAFSERYLLYGYSAGGSIVTRLTLTHPIPAGRRVVGAIAGYGTHETTEPVVNFDVPVVLQASLLDSISPAYSGRIYFDDDMPIAKGVFDLYRELLGGGAVVRLYVDAQGNHGRGPYNLPDGSCEYVAPAIQLFKKTFRGMPPAAYQEFKFSKRAEYLFSDGATIEIDDVGGLYETLGPNPPRFAYVVDRNLGDPLRLFVDGFVYDSTIIVPSGFRYEPIQTILEAGDSPETIRTEFGLP